jgi:hypothetical protein
MFMGQFAARLKEAPLRAGGRSWAVEEWALRRYAPQDDKFVGRNLRGARGRPSVFEKWIG